MAPRQDFTLGLSSGELLPVYALIGSETLLVSEAVALVRKHTLSQAADFNRDEFRAGDTPIERVVQAAGTLPMMAPRRFVHLAGLESLKAKEHEPLLAYLARPCTTTVLVLSGSKIDQRTKLGGALAKSGALFRLEPPKQQELCSWVLRRAKGRGFDIDTEAASLVADLTGTDLGSIDRALEKLALHAGDGQPITSQDVEALVAPTRVHSIFELTAAIGQRDIGRASLLLRNALGGGESALLVLTMIARQFRHLLGAKTLKEQGVPNQQIAQRLGVRPFVVDGLVTQARHYQKHELLAALGAALSADARLKSTRLDAGVVLDRLLVEVMEAAAR